MAAAPTLKLAFILSATDKMSRIVDEAVKKSTNKLSAFERTTSKVGRGMMKAGATMVGAGAAIGGAMYGVARSTANAGDEAFKTAERVGMGAEEWQKIAYAARMSGVENNMLADTFSKLNKRVSDAAGGNKTYMQTFNDLGIKVKDSTGKLRGPMDVFGDLADIFAKVEDGPAKTALAMELFGDTGAKLIPMLNQGREGFKMLGDEALRTGNVLSNDATRASVKFNEDISRLTAGANGLKMTLGTALIPMLGELVTKFTAGITKVTEWLNENPKLANTISKVGIVLAGLLVTVGTASMMIGGLTYVAGQFGKVFRGVSKAIQVGTALFKAAKNGMLLFRIQYAALVVWSKIAAVAQWLFNTAMYACPIVWIIAAIMAVIAAVVLLVKNWDKVVAFFKKIWQKIKDIFAGVINWIKNIWSGITGFFSNLWGGIKNVAGKVWGGIKNVVGKAKEGVQNAWGKTKGFFSNLWGNIKSGAGKGWEGIKKLFLNYTPHGLIIKHWDKIVGFFSNIWAKIKNGITGAWSGIKNWFSNLNPVEWIRGAWDSVGGFFSNLGTRFFEWGKNLISSLWNGIKSVVNKVVDGIKNVGKKIANGFKSIFGINSPSRLFTEYGMNITQGLVIGIDKGGNAVENATGGLAAHTTQGIAENIHATPVAASNVYNGGNSGVSLTYSPQITIMGGASSETRDEFSKMLKQHANEIAAIVRRDAENSARLSFNT